MIAAAILCAILILALAPGARGETEAWQKIDHDPTGTPYVAGELLVAYEPGTSEGTEETIVSEAGARTLENLSEKVRLVSFPSIKHEEPGEAQEQALKRELDDLVDDPRVEAADYNYIREASFIPDDPRFNDQWGLTNAKFPGAWDDARGGGAKIAVVDSGVYARNPDIGKISAQYDFVEGDAVADDDLGHGTQVAGIAGALTNNGKGVAGGCPACRLLVAKVIDANGEATDAKIVEGIGWSVDNGADVVNLSFGGPADSAVLEPAVNEAYTRGAVVVAAAGNEGTTVPQYPAAYPAAIAVSATTPRDRLAGFSSHGDWVDLAAPGTNILSTRLGGGYAQMSGTSMSAPFVSALAGLLASQSMSASTTRQRMQATAADLGPAGNDPSYGHGRIDANRAVR